MQSTQSGAEALGVFWIALFVFGTFLGILWTLLPFAVFGIKKRLDRISDQLASLIELEAQARELDQGGLKPPSLSAKLTAEQNKGWGGLTSASLNDSHSGESE